MGDNLLEEVIIDNKTPDPLQSVQAETTTSNKDDSSTEPESENNSEKAEQNPAVEVNNQEKPETRQCWVCLSTDEEDDETTEWVHPCRCIGSSMWVHQNCLQQWIDEKQKFNSTLSVACTQCNTEYVLVYTHHNGKLFFAIDLCDRILYSGNQSACQVTSFMFSNLYLFV